MGIDFASMSPLEKANLTVSDLSSGGRLVAEQAKQFLRVAIKRSKLLAVVTVLPMVNPTKELPNTQFGGQVLYGGNAGVAVSAGQRSKPNFGKTTLSVKLFKGQVRIDDDVFEENIERAELNQTILTLLGEKVSADMENAAINGDTTSSNTLLSQFDGFLKQVSSHTFAAGTINLQKAILRDTYKTMPIEFRQDKSKLRFITSADAQVDYIDALTNRVGDASDKALVEGNDDPKWGGIPVTDIPLFPQNLGSGTNETNIILCDPKNLTVGILRDVKIEPYRDPDAGQTVFAISLKMDAKIAYEPATTKTTGVKVN